MNFTSVKYKPNDREEKHNDNDIIITKEMEILIQYQNNIDNQGEPLND